MQVRNRLLCGLLCCIIMLTVFTGCAQKKFQDTVTWVPTSSTVPPEPEVLPEVHAASIAHHGGYGYGYPQNTVENITACAKDGWKLVEFDIRWTADGVPVLAHEDELKLYDSKGTINVSTATLEQLKAVRLYSNKNIRVSTLYEVIYICKLYDMTACIEFKAHPTDNQLDELMDYLRNANMLQNCAWASFNLDPLLNVTKRLPEATVMLNLSNPPELEKLTAEPRLANLLDREGETILSYNQNGLVDMENVEDYLNSVKNAGFSIEIWTLDDPELIYKYAVIADYIASRYHTVEEAWEIHNKKHTGR